MEKIEHLFTNKVSEAFGVKRIVSLLYFGSRAFNIDVCTDSDYDFILVLDKYKDSDIFKLRKIAQSKTFGSSDLNINLMYLKDIKVRGKENFQIRSLQASFYSYLENARTLIGRNIFKENLLKLPPKEIQREMDFKIQEHNGRCDKITLQSKSSIKLCNQLQKYTRDILRWVLIREHIMTINDIVKTPFKEMFKLIILNKYLPESLESDLPLLLNKKISSKEIKGVNRIRRTIYEKYLELFAKSNRNDR